MNATLSASGITVRFGGLTVIDKVDLTVSRSEVLGLIGPNGAGKTTFVNVLSGFQKPQEGNVRLGETDITGTPPDHRARLGLVRTFQAVRLFPALTVSENIIASAQAMGCSHRECRQRERDLVELLDLGDWAGVDAGALPYGVERRAGIARALTAKPSFILLDEPAAGMNEDEAFAFLSVVGRIRETDCGVLLIEHNMGIVFDLCDRVHVLRSGSTLAVGTPTEIRNHATVREAYLGSAA
ncbi:ABC transporter ATP-binding protein [Salipiger thiooxidans]|uniref:ABC transporter ATP-binding protein n=1 Tax=Salipiger thiooxidans TaxID=282683 RepID=UPI001CD52423|nr:ABC transporter ATP-binding protein [Salipiger thiooxidans]MCA0851325.1 ABC transporter ATP-binding protein [Salipiger thiooxidans]